MASWSVGVSLRGKNGLSVLTGNGDPSPLLGEVGQPGFIDVSGARLFGPKTASGWPTTFVNLKATAADLPPDLQVNSVVVQPVSGDSNAVQLALKNSSGQTLFVVDANGNVTLAGTLSVAGAATLSNALTVSGLTTLSAALIKLPSSNAAALPINMLDSGGNSLFSVDGQGNIIAKGGLTAQGAASSGSQTVSSLTDTGTLTVRGLSTLADIIAQSIKVKLPASNAAAKPINLVKSDDTALFSLDGSGNLAAAGTATVGALSSTGAVSAASGSISGALSVGGTATLASLIVNGSTTFNQGLTVVGGLSATRFLGTSAGSASAPIFSFTAVNGATAPTSGLYSDGNFGQWYESIGGFVARSITYVNGTPRDQGANFVTHNSYSGVGNDDKVAYRWYVNATTLALSMTGAGTLSAAGALNVAGLTTSAGVKLSSGALTFADGSILSSATVATPASYASSATGTAASPAFRYASANNGAGLYFDGAQGNTFLSVNGFKSLYSTSAANAASGASGWAIASSLGAGSLLLALFGGGSSTVPVCSVDGAGALVNTGLHKTAGLTLTSGAVTFADGTSLTTAPTGGSAGQAGSQLRYNAGPPTTTAPATQNDGDSVIDTTNAVLYGPRANGVFPTQAIANLIGPSGPPGPSMLTSQSAGLGPAFVYTSTVSTTAVNGVAPGTSVASTFAPSYGTALMGLTYTNNSTTNDVTATLVNQSTGATVWSGTLTKNFNGTFGQFTVAQYPMAANNLYVWQLTSSASNTANLFVQPIYLYPAASPSYNVSSLATAALNNTALSTAGVVIPTAGTTTGLSWKFPKASSVFNFTVTSTYTSSVTLVLSKADGTAIASLTVPANSTALVFGAYLDGRYPMLANTQYYFLAKGSGTGTIVVDTQVLFSIA